MKVKDLIEELKKQPSDNNIVIICDDRYAFKDFWVRSSEQFLTIISEDKYKLEKF